MKRILLLILFYTIIFTGCKRVVMPTIIEGTSENTEHPTETISSEATEKETTTEIASTELPTEEVSQTPDEELNIMQRVLLNMETFIDIEDGSVKKVEDIMGYFHNEDGYFARSFYYCDLDRNGTMEVIAIQQGTGARLIFYEIDGRIYMDWGGDRDMADIYEDGVVVGSGGSALFYVRQFMGFTETGKILETIIIWQYPYSDEGKITFYTNWDDYNNRANDIPRDEAITILEGCSGEEVTEYEFTRNNIETILKDYK